jgi:hypothetical protein
MRLDVYIAKTLECQSWRLFTAKPGKPHPRGRDQLQVSFLQGLQMARGTAF